MDNKFRNRVDNVYALLSASGTIHSAVMAGNSFNRKKLGFSKIARGRKNDTFLSISESVLSHAYSKEVE